MPKINIIYGDKTPVVHRHYVYDPEHFKKVVVPVLLRAIEEVETIKEIKVG